MQSFAHNGGKKTEARLMYKERNTRKELERKEHQNVFVRAVQPIRCAVIFIVCCKRGVNS